MIEAWLNRRWYGSARACAALAPPEWLYGAAVSARRLAYRRGWAAVRSAGAPVVVVGNLTVGGTGKTPLTIWLATRLAQRGLAIGLVSRGYGRHSRQVTVLGPDSSWRDVGDEPLLLHRRTQCATAVARDRVAAARALIERGARLILADDGLQHLSLARDCEIVVVDGSRGFGNGRLLPAGPLREPLARLHTVDALVINGPPEHDSLRACAPFLGASLRMTLVPGPARRLVSGETRPIESFRGPAHAVAAIGHPERFFRELAARGVQPIPHPFPDHHPVSAAELDFRDDLPVLMTEKDAVKCTTADPRLWCVPVQAHFSEADAQRLMGLVMRKIDSPTSVRS